MTPESAFGLVVRRRRVTLDISQEELGFRCNLDRTYIGMIERGETNVTLLNIVAIADQLGVSLSTLFREVEQTIKQN